MPSCTTHDIKVTVTCRYAPERSEPERRMWFFVYTVEVVNLGERAAQLRDRHWLITDAEGEVEEVRGAGVVGRQPTLGPMEGFEYSSGCPLRTPFGSMQGSYTMVDEDGDEFEVAIPAFALRNPKNMQ